MIGQLRGTIVEKSPPQLVMDINGVGYEVDAPMSTFYHLPDVGQITTLYTHFIVREDAQQLYGFYSKEERSLFRTLLKVNGVGPRLGLTILSSIEPIVFVQAVISGDADCLVRLPGVGKKTAERLIIEMRDKVSSWTPSAMPTELFATQGTVTRNQITQDAIAALVSLGYKPQEASRAVSKINDSVLTSEEMIRHALREMV